MRRRLAVLCVLVGIFAAGVAAAKIRAGTPDTTTATAATTTTDSTVATTAGTTPGGTIAAGTIVGTTAGTTDTLGAATTSTGSTASASTTTVTTTPRRTSTTRTSLVRKPPRKRRPASARVATPVVRSIDGACLLVGTVVLVRPGHAPELLGTVVQSSGAQAVAGGGIAYPADGSIVTLSAVELTTSGCRGARAARALASVSSLLLFGGAISAQRVELGIRSSAPGGSGTVTGLRIYGRPVTVVPGRRLALQSWGYAVALPRSPIFFDPRTGSGAHPGRERASAALLVHLLQPHAGLPAGTVLLVTFAGLPLERATRLDLPLKVTPPLGLPQYMFPVAGRSDYVDTYGAFRGDVQGNWHHGDDIFAALGTPVVAVADGTLNRPGWDTVGGWRLWVRDSRGNEFYYAHLSGYSPQALHSLQVKAGEVIGFIGNTGDAFTTSPHLHFEIHPRSLLHLNYNGAVDPTRYLDHWQHLVRLQAPKPQHPPFPVGAARQQASFVWRELLAARGLTRHPSRLAARAHQPLGGSGAKQIGPLTAATAAQPNGTAQRHMSRFPTTMLLATFLAAIGVAGLAAALFLRLRRRRAGDAIPETV